MPSKSKLNLSAEDLGILYREVESIIAATRTPSFMKQVRFEYFLNEMDEHQYSKIHTIVTAQLRKKLELWFDKQIEGYWDTQQAEIKESRKRGPRTKIETQKPVKGGEVVAKVGGFNIRKA